MNYLRFIFLIGVFLPLESHAKGHCKNLLDTVAARNSDFLKCAISSAVPVQLCRLCITQYEDLIAAYNSLVHGNETINTNSTINCKDLYFEKDRMNIVATIQEDIAGLWEKGYCYNCYDQNVLSNETSSFFEKQLDFAECIVKNENRKQDPCENCRVKYINLNSEYEQIGKNHKEKICFDIQDAMNRTRSSWSKDLKCCQKKVDFLWFVVVSTIVSSIPLIFYLSFFVYTKRSERNHEMLLPDPETENVGRESATITTREAPEPVESLPLPTSSTSARHQTVKGHNNERSKAVPTESDDDDDDEPLISTSIPNETPSTSFRKL